MRNFVPHRTGLAEISIFRLAAYPLVYSKRISRKSAGTITEYYQK